MNIVPNTKGYPQVSHAGANKFATVGEVVVWAKGQQKPPHYDYKKSSADVSHLCVQPRCTVLAHIVLESAAMNNSRKGCVAWAHCSRDCRRCNGTRVILLCSHKPSPCVRYHEGYRSQEHLLRDGVCRDDSEITRQAEARRRQVAQEGLTVTGRGRAPRKK